MPRLKFCEQVSDDGFILSAEVIGLGYVMGDIIQFQVGEIFVRYQLPFLMNNRPRNPVVGLRFLWWPGSTDFPKERGIPR